MNEALFLALNASAQPDARVLAVALFFGVYAIWSVPLVLAACWLRGRDATRRLIVQAGMAAVAGLLLNQAIALFWEHPRPFMVGQGHTLIAHVADSSFPSDHLTLLWSVAFTFLLHRRLRRAGTALALIGLPMAWGRIYLGVHYPFDMLGAVGVSLMAAWWAQHEQWWLAWPLHRALMALRRQARLLPGVHRVLR